jgi:thioesterase domain-containing protein
MTNDAALREHGLQRAGPAEALGRSSLPVELLRDGEGADVVFFFPGLGGEASELRSLTGRLVTPGRMFGLSYTIETGRGDALRRMAGAAVATVRTVQPNGPYRLVGYSFGALVAVEVAQQLKRAGERVMAPILIDAYYDQKFWPLRAWWLGLINRTRVQLVRIGRQAPGPAVQEFLLRATRLARRIRARSQGSEPQDEPAPATLSAATMAALRTYEPPPVYPGSLVLLSAADSTTFGCRPVDLWRSRNDGVAVEDVAGDHLELVRNPESLERLALAVDRHLHPQAHSNRPVALVVTTFNWPITASLVAALIRNGFKVVALCPPRHPMRRETGLVWHRLPWRHPERALKNLVARVAPDLVLPCDEPALDMVRSISPSLPGICTPLSRSEANDIARDAGVKAPQMQPIEDAAELDAWIVAHGLPIVLKTDGSWGGRGVAIVRDKAQALAMWRRLSRGPSLLRAVKRALLNADRSVLQDLVHGHRPRVNAQVHVPGRDANVALAVNDGKVLAAVAVEVLEHRCENGPARLVRVIDHPGILAAAVRLMECLRLTGLVGIDFILDAEGAAHLIEINARVTPTCRLALGRGRDPVGALRGAFPGAVTSIELQDAVGQVIDIDALAQLDMSRGIEASVASAAVTV